MIGSYDLEKIKALIEGVLSNKQIQKKNLIPNSNIEWDDTDGKELDWYSVIQAPGLYRVKPESKYRAFKSISECIEECKKHEPFGYIQNVLGNAYSITAVYNNKVILGTDLTEKLENAFRNYVFLDGSKFGKIDE